MLVEHYGREHQVVVYEASRTPAIDSVRQTIRLDRLADVRIRESATLYVPPLERCEDLLVEEALNAPDQRSRGGT